MKRRLDVAETAKKAAAVRLVMVRMLVADKTTDEVQNYAAKFITQAVTSEGIDVGSAWQIIVQATKGM